MVHRETIEEALVCGRNAKGIWQDLVDRQGFAASYESVKRYVRDLRGAASPVARTVIEAAPGEEAQVAYGQGPLVYDPETGKYRRTRLFVLTLGYGRKCVRLLSWSSSSQTWRELHEEAFRRLGGAPRVVVLDNLREGVRKPDIWDPALSAVARCAPLLNLARAVFGRMLTFDRGEVRRAAGKRRSCGPCQLD